MGDEPTIKRNAELIHATTRMSLRNMPSERSSDAKATYHSNPHEISRSKPTVTDR